MPKTIGSYQVLPVIPEKISGLKEIAYNLFWTWNPDIFELFRRIDEDLWEATHHNPIELLGKVSQSRLNELSNDSGFVSHYSRVYNKLQEYLLEETWFQKTFGKTNKHVYAYFAAEYGLTDCLKFYSGGLGVLSGDTLKSASDLGLPLVGVGIAYREGYFQQYLNSEGWQLETYPINDFYNLPMVLVKDENNRPLTFEIDFPKGKVKCQIWKIQIGRIPLFLLDTNIPDNIPEYKMITNGLYRGTIETRIQQEIVLGIGGIRALRLMGYSPEVCHMNEGHSAFLSLEKIRILMKDYNLSFQEAYRLGYMTNVFTTHTPVPAGFDIFSGELIEKYLGNVRNELGLSYDDFMKLGNLDNQKRDSFNMAHLAMRMSGYINGVSKLHSQVSRNMWSFGWKNIPKDEIPIDAITNGVHLQSHLSYEIITLFNRYLGEDWIDSITDQNTWNKIEKIPDVELWLTHERRRERLVAFARKNLQEQLIRQGAPISEIEKANEVLNPKALTIGFARRFATYKRATLLFHNLDRLRKILKNEEYPVQIIFAGKAHPQDEEGKNLIKEINKISKDPELRRKIVFLENYDLNIARYLVQGCDVWLNTPRRPLEASGTSGMKAAVNGVINFSILDGWWCEGYSADLGWAIGLGEEYTDSKYQDEVEANLIYQILENEIIPTFYKRGLDDIPREWVKKMKNSIKNLPFYFNTHRMVKEYLEKFYLKAAKNKEMCCSKDFRNIKQLVEWEKFLYENWDHLKIFDITCLCNKGEVNIGSSTKVKAKVFLNKLKPEDVSVEIYYGKLNGTDEIQMGRSVTMRVIEKKEDYFIYEGEIPNEITGLQGYTIRILPNNELLTNKFQLGLIYWAQ